MDADMWIMTDFVFALHPPQSVKFPGNECKVIPTHNYTAVVKACGFSNGMASFMATKGSQTRPSFWS